MDRMLFGCLMDSTRTFADNILPRNSFLDYTFGSVLTKTLPICLFGVCLQVVVLELGERV